MTGKFVFALYWLGCIFIFCCTLVSAITIFFLLFHCRSDAAQSNLRTSSYEALMDLIKYSGKDCYVVVQKTAIHILEKLQKIIQLDNVSWFVSSMYSLSLFFFEKGTLQGPDKQHLADFESLLCATLQVWSFSG